MTLFWAYSRIVFVSLIAIAATSCGVLGSVKRRRRRRLLAGLVQDGPALQQWMQNYSASEAQIAEFLKIFGEAFGLSKLLDVSRLAPETRLIDVYRALNPVQGIGDSFEFEMLSMELEDHYDISFTEAWKEDMTLGELFEMVASRSTQHAQ